MRMLGGKAASIVHFAWAHACFNYRAAWVVAIIRRHEDVAVFVDLSAITANGVSAATTVTHGNVHRQIVVCLAVAHPFAVSKVQSALPPLLYVLVHGESSSSRLARPVQYCQVSGN